jgi:hypothetical protein
VSSFLGDSLGRGRASRIATEDNPGTLPYSAESILELGYARLVAYAFRRTQLKMAGAPISTIASGADSSAERTRRQIAFRLLPFVFVLYITNYLDRTSLAYAAIGMARDLGFNDHVLGMGIGVFFVSYVALQIPGALIVERWSRAG